MYLLHYAKAIFVPLKVFKDFPCFLRVPYLISHIGSKNSQSVHPLGYKWSFHSYKIELLAKRYGTFSPKISICPSILTWSCSMWHSHLCCHYPMCCPCFLALKLSSLYLMIFKHPYLTHMKSNFGIFYCYEFNMSFYLHLSFGFSTWRKKFLPSIWEDSME